MDLKLYDVVTLLFNDPIPWVDAARACMMVAICNSSILVAETFHEKVKTVQEIKN